MNFRIIHRFRNRYPLIHLCALLDVSRSGYYKWLHRMEKPDKDEFLANLIQQCHQRTRRTYGYRRVKLWILRETGLLVNHKAVLRIMRKYGLLAPAKRKHFKHYECTTYHRFDNLLNRDFHADRPNQKWVTDISYIPTKEGFLYLSVIKDLYDKSIVAYRYATDMPARLVVDTIRAAVKAARPKAGLLLHSDRGFQYASIPYFNVTKANHITPSMSRVGNPYDNACVESFFSLLKNECIHRAKPTTIQQAMALIDEYIGFYNKERIQLNSGLTPFEMRFA